MHEISFGGRVSVRVGRNACESRTKCARLGRSANVSCQDTDEINENSDPDSDCCLQGDYWHQVLVTISVASLASRQGI